MMTFLALTKLLCVGMESICSHILHMTNMMICYFCFGHSHRDLDSGCVVHVHVCFFVWTGFHVLGVPEYL